MVRVKHKSRIYSAKRKTPKNGAEKEGDRKKRRRTRKALREIRHYQQTVDFVTAREPFRRHVLEIARKVMPDVRFQAAAIEALRVAMEMHVTLRFAEANDMALLCRRVTIMPRDINIVQKMRTETPEMRNLNAALPYDNDDGVKRLSDKPIQGFFPEPRVHKKQRRQYKHVEKEKNAEIASV